MSLAIEKLKNIVRRVDGAVIARCPACAESGHDKSADHLIIYGDGRFGCVANPGDHQHRQRIWALVGERKPRRVVRAVRRPVVRPAIFSTPAQQHFTVQSAASPFPTSTSTQ